VDCFSNMNKHFMWTQVKEIDKDIKPENKILINGMKFVKKEK